MAMLPTSMVNRLMGMLNQPITPSIIIIGARLGTILRRPMRRRPIRIIIRIVMTIKAYI
ncbi:hypothetical protein ES703_118116 [subsurface metagenome]